MLLRAFKIKATQTTFGGIFMTGFLDIDDPFRYPLGEKSNILKEKKTELPQAIIKMIYDFAIELCESINLT